jgi:two-component system response regulator PilR (NtrC family)
MIMFVNKEKSILVVDDERIFTFLLAEELSEFETYTVKTTYTGEDALKEMEKNTYDLIITDLKLPGISGLEFVSVAKKLSPESKFIVMTAHNVHKLQDKMKALGVFRCIYKPFSISKIRDLVKDALSSGMKEKNWSGNGDIAKENAKSNLASIT